MYDPNVIRHKAINVIFIYDHIVDVVVITASPATIDGSSDHLYVILVLPKQAVSCCEHMNWTYQSPGAIMSLLARPRFVNYLDLRSELIWRCVCTVAHAVYLPSLQEENQDAAKDSIHD